MKLAFRLDYPDLSRRIDPNADDPFFLIQESLDYLFLIPDKYGFDLWQHVELKLKYNATRPRMHGKKF